MFAPILGFAASVTLVAVGGQRVCWGHFDLYSDERVFYPFVFSDFGDGNGKAFTFLGMKLTSIKAWKSRCCSEYRQREGIQQWIPRTERSFLVYIPVESFR